MLYTNISSGISVPNLTLTNFIMNTHWYVPEEPVYIRLAWQRTVQRFLTLELFSFHPHVERLPAGGLAVLLRHAISSYDGQVICTREMERQMHSKKKPTKESPLKT